MDNMKNQPCENNCTYYVDKFRMPIYKQKFLWTIVGATMIAILIFIGIALQYKKSLDDVVAYHSRYAEKAVLSLPEVKLSKDSCYYLNERLVAEYEVHNQEMETLLKLQSSKIQSDFTLLSVWAGVLMIVFLIFSIYSMFKTDELVKQGREALTSLEETKNHANDEVKRIDTVVQQEMVKVQNTASAEIEKLSAETQDSLKQIKEEINASTQEFEKNVEGNVKKFESAYASYIEKLQLAEQNTTSLFKQMRVLFSEQLEMEKSDQSSQSESNGTK